MSLTIQQIITDAKQLAGKLKERESIADMLVNDSQAAIKRAAELRQYEDEVIQLNDVANLKPHSELIANIQKENRHLREIQQENKELRAALEEHQTALEYIMSKYRTHASEQIYRSRINFVKFQNKRYNEIIRQQAEKINEMAAVMDQAALIDEQRANTDEEIMARLKVENKGLRELLQISYKYGSDLDSLRSSKSQDKIVQTEAAST